MPTRHYPSVRLAIGFLLAVFFGIALPGCTQSRADEFVDAATAPAADPTALSTPGETTTTTVDGVAWPATWASRSFFDRPTAYIYAASASGAKEAEQIMREASRDFFALTGANASKGLIIVTDAKDALPAEEAQIAQIISNRLRAYRTTTQPTALTDPDQDPSVEWSKQKKKFDDAGLPIGELLRILPSGVVSDDLTGKLGLPTHVAMQTPWAALLPTRAACKRSAHELTRAVMKSKGITFGQRLLIAPWLPMMESIMTDELAAERVVTLVNEDALSRSDWDASRKQRYIGEYRDSKNKERQKRMSVHEKDMKAKGAPTSMPAGKS